MTTTDDQLVDEILKKLDVEAVGTDNRGGRARLLFKISGKSKAKQALIAWKDQAVVRARIDEAEKIYTNYIPTGTLVGKAVRRRINKYKKAISDKGKDK